MIEGLVHLRQYRHKIQIMSIAKKNIMKQYSKEKYIGANENHIQHENYSRNA